MPTFSSLEKNFVVVFQSFSHVIGIKDGHLCSVTKTLWTHHLLNGKKYYYIRLINYDMIYGTMIYW